MKTNTELLMNVLGWQGGTVHQVSSVTCLKVVTILDLDKEKITDPYQLEMYNLGFNWVMAGSNEHNIPKGCKGYPLFFLGAMDAQKAKETQK